MDREDFLKYLKSEVTRFQTTWSLSNGKAFAMWYAIEEFDLDEQDAYEAASYDGGNDKGVEFILFD